MLIQSNIMQEILFKPVEEGADSLCILSGYASPSMASWYIKALEKRRMPPINISLILGMTPYNGLSRAVHDGFRSLHHHSFENNECTFSCSYVYMNPPIRSNLYLWMRGGIPVKAFVGNADFLQNTFLRGIQHLVEECSPEKALRCFNEAEAVSMYCSCGEVEEAIIIRPNHPILDEDGKPLMSLEGDGIESVRLSHLSSRGDTGMTSGLNWGQREGRNKNEAYIRVPSTIAKSGFFPPKEQHFIVVTDDGKNLLLRIEQENDKAITTPMSNALLGEYFRNRLGLANGEFVAKEHLQAYGRTDVTFYKIDEEQYFMDFSVHPEV